MDRFINTSLFTFGNIAAIGSILIFWALVAFAVSNENSEAPGA